MSRWSRLIATGAGAGYLPVAPGTWGSLQAVVLAALLIWPAGVPALPALAAATLLAVAAGIPAAGALARRAGREDPSEVVIDEIAGQWLTLLFVPLTPLALVAGFFLFRLFDIIKPPPVRQLERWPGGWGIVADDLAAGVFAGVSLRLLTWLAGG